MDTHPIELPPNTVQIRLVGRFEDVELHTRELRRDYLVLAEKDFDNAGDLITRFILVRMEYTREHNHH